MGILVLVMCGLPGAGKTFLSSMLQERFHSDERAIRIIRYDTIAQQMQWNAHSFHAVRSLGLAALREAIAEAKADASRKEHVIIMDDNMHRKSMRREVYVVVRDEEVASLLVYCNADRETCALRNARREDHRVTDESFSNVCEQFEPPHTHLVFDRPLVTVDSNDLEGVARCLHSLWNEMLTSQTTCTPREAESERQAHPQAKSALQRVDEEIRRRVGSLLATHRQTRAADLRHAGEELARVKRETLCTARLLLPAFVVGDTEVDLDGFLATCLQQFERRTLFLSLSPSNVSNTLDAHPNG